MKQLFCLGIAVSIAIGVKAQDILPTTPGLLKLKSGTKYKITKKMASGLKLKEGDYAIIHVKSKLGDSVVYDSRISGKTIEATVILPYYNGDINEIFPLLKKGESVVAFVPKDSVFRGVKAPRLSPPYDYVRYDIDVLDAIPQAKVANWIKDKDDKAILAYFAQNNISDYKKTASGLYYRITQEGSGRMPKKGEEVSMNYSGKLIDGKVFDSNTDPAFNHVQPLDFTVGAGGLKGMDEGVALLKEGGKATLYIPSGLAHGSSTKPNIPANSPLFYDIELLKILPSAEERRAAEDAQIQKYLNDNNLKGTKTPSGMYYVIMQEGSGEKPSVGKKVSANYTGSLLDGTKFDSNTDSAFNHVTPLEFELGKKNVIAGWEEGFALLNKGSKAKLIIPSVMGYGKQPSGKIPANSILIFDVELLDFK